MDFMFNKNWFFNVDVKYIMMDIKVKLDGVKFGLFDLNLVIVGIGIGYCF